MSDKLIRVQKDGQFLSVNPVTLDAHKSAGWSEAADQTPGEHDLDAPEAKGKGGKKADSADPAAE